MQAKKNPAADNSGARSEEATTTSAIEYNTSVSGGTNQICTPDEVLDQVPETDPIAEFADLGEAFYADEKDLLDDDFDPAAEAIRAADVQDAAANPLTAKEMKLSKLVSITGSRRPIAALMADATRTYIGMQVDAGYKRYLRNDTAYLMNELIAICDKITDALNRKAKEEGSSKRPPHTPVGDLPSSVIVAAFEGLYSPVRIQTERNRGTDGPLMTYVDDPDDMDYGIYVSASSTFETFVDAVTVTPVPSPTIASMARAVRNHAPVVKQSDARLVVMANGILDYKEQKLLPFSPDRVFLSKADVAWNPDATLPLIEREDGSTWDIESSLRELSAGDDEVLALYWQVIGAALRATEKWKKLIVFYGPQGNNGKSTILTLVEHLVGRRNVMSSDLAALSERFGRDQLIPETGGTPQLIISHENDEPYLPKIGALKALVTQDSMKVERKGEKNVAFNWRGLILQGINELLKTRESNGSVTRRLLLVPFMAEIIKPEDADGAGSGQIIEEPAVVEDYVTRREVLEYVAYRALSHDMTPEYTHFTIPEASRELLAEQVAESDLVTQFWEDVADRLAWGFVPSAFLYDLYVAWMGHTNSSAHPIGQKALTRKLKEVVRNDLRWKWPDTTQRPGDKMDEPEPMIVEYDLERWTNLRAGKTNTRARATLRPDQIPGRCAGIVYVGQGMSGAPVDARGPSRPNGVGEADSPDPEPVQAPNAPQER